MLDGVVKPKIKNKFGDVSSSDNYRKVMISTCMFKLFVYCIPPIMMIYPNLSHCQFINSRYTSTSLSTFFFKETVGRYLSENS